MDIPCDIYFNIFTRLRNTCQLLALRSVCKQWRDMIDDPSCFDAHIARMDRESVTRLEDWRLYAGGRYGGHCFYTTLIDRHGFPEVTAAPGALHSCYGLLLSCNDNGNLYVQNPITGSLWNLPPLDPTLLCSSLIFKNPGIGYDPYTRTFKVVFLSQDVYRNMNTVYLHTLGSSEWRVLKKVQLPVIDQYQAAVYLKGCIYWMTYDDVVICMDLREETIERMPRIPCSFDRMRKLLIWKGSLAASCMVEHAASNVTFDIWVLNDSTERVWTKECHLSRDFLSEFFPMSVYEKTPVAGVRDGRVVLFVANDFRSFIYYDVEEEQVITGFDLGNDHYRYSTDHFSHFNTMTKKVSIHV